MWFAGGWLLIKVYCWIIYLRWLLKSKLGGIKISSYLVSYIKTFIFIMHIIYTDGTFVSLWWHIAFYTPFYLHFVIHFQLYIIHRHTHFYLVFVSFSLFSYLCVFYDLIHVLIVYVHFRAIIFQYSNVYSVAYWRRVITFKAELTEEGRVQFFCCLTYGESKTSLWQAVISTVSIP